MKDLFSHKIFSGIVFITVGILWLLNSLYIIDISWRDVWHLWPLILIWIGISCLPIQGIYRLILNSVVLFVGVLFLVIPNPFSAKNRENCKSDKDTIVSCVEYSTTIIDSDTLDFAYTEGFIEVNVGAGTLRIEPSNEVAASTGKDKLNMSVSLNANSHFAEIKAENSAKNVSRTQDFILGLNPYPIWNMDFEIGAVDGELDLSVFKVKKMKLKTGASAIKLRFGDLHPEIEANVETGASSITIEVPKTMRCIVEKESALVDFSLDGFKKSADKKYMAEAEGKNKGTIKLSVSAGVAKIKVVRY